jgi:hypothetical protein
VPEQLGTWNVPGAGGNGGTDLLQQIRFGAIGQSLSCMQLFGQVAAHTPPQQIGVALVALQSDDCVHDAAHAVTEWFRHSPAAVTFGSRMRGVEQQTSPFAVLQAESRTQDVGQSLGAVQMGFA